MQRHSTSRQQFVRVCQCGCGEPTLLAAKTSIAHRSTRGQPLRFLNGHQSRGCNNASFHGGRYQTAEGYWYVRRTDHPFADKRGYIEEHRVVLEEAIGRLLSPDEVCHHIDENRANNHPANLVAMNRADHARLHLVCPTWSWNEPQCVDCGTTERPHDAKGRCRRCYNLWRYQHDVTYRERVLAKQKAARLDAQ